MLPRRLIALLVLPMLTSCITIRSSLCDPLWEPTPQLTDTKVSRSRMYRDVADTMYLYAQMSVNAYGRATERFILPDSIALRDQPEDTTTGFAAQIYEVKTHGALSRVIIAFRGTEAQDMAAFKKDMTYGNIGWRQNSQADSLYRVVRERYPAAIPIAVTGHSLGGGLAYQVSTSFRDVPAYVIEASYHVHEPVDTTNDNIGVAETGEIVKLVRVLLANVSTDYYPGFSCTSGGPVANHDQTRLARCLTHYAALDLPTARWSLQRNAMLCSVGPSVAEYRRTHPDAP
jgi:hypothetical protein